jgi:hypothetical protein
MCIHKGVPANATVSSCCARTTNPPGSARTACRSQRGKDGVVRFGRLA